MTVPSDVNKSGPYFGNGVTTAFNYDFKVVDETHLSVVVRDTVSGVQRTLVLNSDYTVTGVGNSGGGQIITTTAPTSNETLTILRNIPFTQDVDLENQGAYYAETVESALDLMVMRDQQLAEELERSIKLPADADPSLLPIMTEGLHRLYQSVDAIDTVAASVDDVETVAANIADVNALGPVASDIADVASIKSHVSAVAENLDAVYEVGDIATEIAALGAIPDAIVGVYDIASDVTAVASIKDDVQAVPGVVQEVKDARDDAVVAKNAAQAAASAAAGSASSAAGSASTASTQASNAANSASAAANAKTAAESARDAAINAKNDAQGYASAASGSASAAAGSASDAQGYASAAAGSASSASTHATNAANSALAAAGSASAANDAKEYAETARDEAVQAKEDAEAARDQANNIVGNLSGGLAGQFLVKNSNSDYDYGWANISGGGDMLASVYDPNGVAADAFNMDNMVEGLTNKILTAAERADIAANTSARHTHSNKSILDATEQAFTTALKNKLDGIQEGAQVNPGNATPSSAGLMSASDKSKLDGIEANAQVNTVDSVAGLTGTITDAALFAALGLGNMAYEDSNNFVSKAGDEMQGGLVYRHGDAGTNVWMHSYQFGDKPYASIGVDLYNDGSLDFHTFDADTGAWKARVIRLGNDGFVALNDNPTQAMHAATKGYVDDNFVSFSQAQTLTPTQQEQARANIGAADFTSNPVLVTVGPGGDYPSINAALAAVSKRFLRQYQSEGLTVEVRLKSGFTMSEQVIVERQDLSWITITSDDASVPATVVASPVRASENDAGSACLFAGRHNAKLPRIGALFRYTSQITNSNIGGIGVYWGSSVEILPGCGVQNSHTGLQVLYGSSVVSSPSGMRSSAAIERGANFEDTYARAVDVQYGSYVSLPRLDASNSGRGGADAVYVNWNSMADIRQGNISGCAATDFAAVRVRDGSVVCARETDVSGSFGHGYYASHASVLDARADGSVGAPNCAQDGLRAEGACIVDATDIDVSGCSTGIRADGSCLVHALRANASNSTWEGFLALNGSTINAGLSTANNCSRGYDARNTSTINAQGGSANNCSTTGLYAYQNSTINFEDGNAQSCGIGIDAQRCSRVNVTNAVFTGCTTHAIRGNRGSHIEAQGAAARRGGSDNSDDVVVASGSIINKAGGTGGVSQTKNTITAAGIIFG